jgi:hypothetical protein
MYVQFQLYIYLRLNFAIMLYATINWKENEKKCLFSHVCLLVYV